MNTFRFYYTLAVPWGFRPPPGAKFQLSIIAETKTVAGFIQCDGISTVGGDTPIEILGLPRRLRNRLAKIGVSTVWGAADWLKDNVGFRWTREQEKATDLTEGDIEVVTAAVAEYIGDTDEDFEEDEWV